MGCSSSSPKVAGTSGPIDAKRTEVKPRPDGGVEESKADGTGAGAGAGAGANKDSKAAELQATLRSHGYTLGPVLGQGGFGQVNLCTDTDGKECVLLSCVCGGGCILPPYCARIRRVCVCVYVSQPATLQVGCQGHLQSQLRHRPGLCQHETGNGADAES